LKNFLRLLRDAPIIIRKKFAALPLWSKYAAVGVILCAIAGIYIWRYALRKDLVSRQIAGYNIDRGGVDDLWFSPTGELIAVEADSSFSFSTRRYFKFNVLVWSPAGQGPERRPFDAEPLIQIWNRNARYLDPRLASRTPSPSQPLSALDVAERPGSRNVAVSRDGREIAFLYNGVLIISSEPDEIDWAIIPKSDSISGLAFTDSGLVALAYTDGKIEFRDSDPKSIVGSASTKLTAPSLMKSFGNYLAAVSAINAGVVVLDMRALTRDAPTHGYPPTSLGSLGLAVSKQGRLGVATGAPTVFLTQSDATGDASIQLESYGPVEALSFYDNTSVLVAGRVRDIYLLTEGETPRNVAVAPEGAGLIAANQNSIAYVEPKGVVLMSYSTVRVLRTRGKVAIWITGAVLFGLFGLYLYDLRSTRREEEELAEKPSIPVIFELPKELPQDLVETCARGECVLYAGAGLGAQSGLPMWTDFVNLLLRQAFERELISRDETNVYRAEIYGGYADQVADSIISRFTTADERTQLNTYMRKLFLRSAMPSAAHNLLAKINFSAVLTSNLDDLLERTLPDYASQIYTPNDAETLLGALTTRAHFILKLYGTLERPETVIVAPAQYELAVAGNRLFSQFMQTLFVSRTLLFIGCSLEGIETYLKGISLVRETVRTHYALVAVSGNTWRAKADVLERRYGIKVIAYTPTGDYEQLKEFLEMLTARVEARQTPAADVKTAKSRLQRLYLENIGPFNNLELKFDPDMQILLGDNGVGKSTILKALAIALCGEEARPYAGRILKTGKFRGSITLETDNKTSYVTTIVRSSTGEAEMISNTARPLETEGWLALGFPPLRTTSWTPLKGPDSDFKMKSRPVADDLLPLVKGEVDPRIDKLKQWIVNLDYLNIKGTESNSADGRYQKLADKVFDVIATVMEGMKLKYAGVEPVTNRVLLKTDDGNDVPLEVLSQGTISLIGWIGILMQRLYEVFEDKDPTQQYALVLMDEIDAHMHPLWQRTLLGHLRKVFPRAQFIATTHSPLVIGGMPAQQVLRFAREANGAVSVLSIPPDATLGYTDQILTSMLFGLPTTLDQTTKEKMDEYYRLYEMEDHGGLHEKYEQLKQELMLRVPPPSGSYLEKREEQLSMAEMLRELGDKLKEVSPQSGNVLVKRADNLRESITGGKKDDPN